MKLSDRVYYAVPVVLLLAVAFLIGFIVPDVRASRGDMAQLSAQMVQLPTRLKMLAGTSSDSDSDLPVVQTYCDVLGKLREGYYGSQINDRKLTYDAIRGMLLALNDPYTRFLDPESYSRMREENEGNFVGIGAQLDVNKSHQVYIKEPIPDSPALKAGVKSGDIILKVDGKSIAGMDIDKVVERIRGEEGTKVKLTLARNGQKNPVELTIPRRIVEFRMVKSKMLDPKNRIGYVRLYGFNEHSDSQFDAALTQLEKQKVAGIVMDLRGNPGGLLQVAVDIGSRFVQSGPIVVIQNRNGRRESLDVEDSKHDHRPCPLVVLVDKHSASASEIVSGAIQDSGVGTIVGTYTFGKARVQTVTTLNDGSAVAITTAKYLTPKLRDINKVGVKPDIFVESPDESVELGDMKLDTQLLKGIDVLKEKMGIKAATAVAADSKKAAQKIKR